MIKRIWIHLIALACLVWLGALTAGAQSIDAFPRTTAIVPTDLLLVQTNSAGAAGQKFTRSITGSNLLESLMDFPNWTGAGGSATNAQPPSTVLTNLATTGVEDYATNRFLLPSIFTNTVYVNARGANQAANGLLLTNALATAPAFCRIVVGPGDYFVAEVANPSPSFATDNRWIDFQPGANWRAGSTSGAAFFMFDDDLAKVTNVWVTGRGNFFQTNIAGSSGNLLQLGQGSTVYFEHQNAYLTNADSMFNLAGVGNNTLNWITHGKATTMTYDNAYFTMTSTNRVRAFFNEIESVGDIIELGGNAPEWGDVVIGYNSAKAINGLSGQASIMQIGGRAIVKNGTLNVDRLAASIYSTSATTNGLLEGGTITMPPNGTRSVLQDNSDGTGAPFNGLTALWMKNLTVICATNVDAITLTNGAAAETVLENVTFNTGFASTNVIRAATPSKVRILGNLGVFPPRPIGANITIVGTNVAPAIDNLGTLVQRGTSRFSNDVEVTASMVTLKGATQLSAESEIFANSFFITNLFYIPFLYNGATVDGTGAMFQHSNTWATGRGTLLFNDQTADVAVVATLKSDAPSNGQVPTWNTGGTITWETPSAGGGSLATNANQFGASTTLTIKDGASVTNLTNYGSLSMPGGTNHALIDLKATNGVGQFTIGFDKDQLALTTNFFSITNVTAGQALTAHSSSGGTVVWTNGTPSLPSYALTNNQSTTVAFLGGLDLTDQLRAADIRATGLAEIGTLAVTNSIIYTPVAKTGVGGANTNFTLLSTQPEVYINGFTNVSIRAVMGYDAATVAYWTCVITNGSGSDRTIEFSAVTNRYRFTGAYGTNAPVTLTNNTTLEISGRQVGTNVFVAYGYFAWP